MGALKAVMGMACAVIGRGYVPEAYTANFNDFGNPDVSLGVPVQPVGVREKHFPVHAWGFSDPYFSLAHLLQQELFLERRYLAVSLATYGVHSCVIVIQASHCAFLLLRREGGSSGWTGQFQFRRDVRNLFLTELDKASRDGSRQGTEKKIGLPICAA